MKGPDAALLTDRDGEGLRALETIASQILRLDPMELERVSFDANDFKAPKRMSSRPLPPTQPSACGRAASPSAFRR